MSKKFLLMAVDMVGTQVALADAIRLRVPGCKVQQAHISKWLLRSKAEVPPGEYVVAISEIVGWRVTPHQLRPDLYPNPTDAMPAESREAA